MDAIFLSHGGAETAGHHTTDADIQDWQAAAPAVVMGRLTLHARETKQSAATLMEEKTQEKKREK